MNLIKGMLQRVEVRKVAVAAAAFTASAAAFAAPASLLDATSKQAISDGYSAVQLTSADLLSSSWPFILAMIGYKIVPKLVRGIASRA